MKIGKLVVDGPTSGQENMARDELLLDLCGKSGIPMLRFYQWERPTLSLGYFQKLEEVSDLPLPNAEVDLCRRPTGGGAILHHLELTFSLCLPDKHPLVQGRVEGSYLKICQPLLELCKELGLEADWRGDPGEQAKKAANCFAGRACPDMVVEGLKIFGAAQRRRGGAVLTHGSLLLGGKPELWKAVFGERLEDGYASVDQWIEAPEPAVLAMKLTEAWGRLLGLQWEALELQSRKRASS